MIGQNRCTESLVPLALHQLRDNPFVAGHFFPGDLLSNVLKLPDYFWSQHPGRRTNAVTIATSARERLTSGSIQCADDNLDTDAVLSVIDRFFNERSQKAVPE
jgi:hypothetical protein